jgi:AcrR family transcriptional regulator
VSFYSFNKMPATDAALPSGLRARQRVATRQLLIQAGLSVVAESGFAGATTAAIAEASGRAHGTVFLHFPSRDALVAELVEAVGQAMSAALADLPDDQAGVAEVLDAHLQALQTHEVLYARLLREATQLPPAARARVFALQTGIAWHLRQAHARDAARGLAREADPLAVGNVWIALSNHYLINRDLFAPGGSVIASRGAELKAQMLAIVRR